MALKPLAARLVLFCTAVQVLIQIGSCADPYGSDPRYVKKNWTQRNGLPAGSVYSITQSWDGYLWIGSEVGPVRFDGHEFQLKHTSDSGIALGPALRLGADREDALWIMQRTPSMLRFKNGKTTDISHYLDSDFEYVRAVSQIARGRFFAFAIEKTGSRVLEFADSAPKQLARFSGGLVSPVVSMAQTNTGEIWLGTWDAGVCRVQNDRCICITKGLPDAKVNALVATSHNVLWIGTDAGLVRWDGNKLVQTGVPEPLLKERILALAEDAIGNVWIGTGSKGLVRLDVTGQSYSENSNAQQADAVSAIFQDRERNLWVARTGGIEEITARSFVMVPVGNDKAGGGAIYADQKGRIWCAPAAGGLYELDADGRVMRSAMIGSIVYSIDGDEHGVWAGDQRGRVTYIPFQAHSEVRTYTVGQGPIISLAADADGSLWVGTLTQGAIRLRGELTRDYTISSGLRSDTINAIAAGPDGSIWLGTPAGLTRFFAGRWRSFARASDDSIACLFFDRQGVLWAGGKSGLSFFQNGRLHTVDLAGLQGEVSGISEDKQDNLWIVTANGVLRANRNDLWRERARAGFPTRFGAAQGLNSTETARRSSSVARDGFGRLWIYFNDGIAMTDPAGLQTEAVPVNAFIESVEEDGVISSPGTLVHVAPGTQRIRIRFTGLSLSAPDRVRFRYRLQQFDAGWSQSTSIREAVYTNLPPGPYTFAVEASILGGAWEGEVAELAIRVNPAYWETWWFRTCCLAALALGSTLAYQIRVRQMTSRLNIRFEEQLNERARIAQQLHDTLLQGVIAVSMQMFALAESLTGDGAAQAKVARASEFLAGLVDEGRRTVYGLKSPRAESADLEQSLAQVALDLGADNVKFRVVSRGKARPLNPLVRDEIYRICCEAIANAFRHSGATEMAAEILFTERLLKITIRDNGCGIDPKVLKTGKEGHFGLPGMRERAEKVRARLHLWTTPGHGTEVELSVPAAVAFSRLRHRRSRPRWLRALRRPLLHNDKEI